MSADAGRPQAEYAPPPWLRNPHVQTVLGSSPWRRRAAASCM
jgi:hypothetical protein